MCTTWLCAVSLAVLAASVRADFVLRNMAQPLIEYESPLFYDALSDTWRFHISCPVSSETSLIIPQLCLPEDVDQCRQESVDDTGSCESINSLIRTHNGSNSSWVNVNLQRHNDSECIVRDGDLTQAQLIYGSATAAEFMRGRQPDYVTVSRNPSLLLRFAAPDPHGHRIFVRVLCLSEYEGRVQRVKSQNTFLVLGDAERPLEEVIMTNECVLRGLTSPRRGENLLQGGSYLQVVPDIFGNRACRWGCGAGIIKFPWNSAPLQTTDTAVPGMERACITLPKSFMAVEFVFTLYSNVPMDPHAFNQLFLDGLDMLALSIQSSLATTLTSPIVLCDVLRGPDVFSALVRTVSRGTHETVASTVSDTLHTPRDIVVRAVVFHQSMLQSVFGSEQAIAKAFGEAQHFAFPENLAVTRIVGLEITAVHRVTGPRDTDKSDTTLARTMIRTLQVTCVAVALVAVVSYVIRHGAPL